MPENLLELWEKATPVKEDLNALWEKATPSEPKTPSGEGLLKGMGKAIVSGATSFPKAFWGAGTVLEDLAYKGFGGKDEYKDLSEGGFARKRYEDVKGIEERFQPQQKGLGRYVTNAVQTMSQMASNFAGTVGMGTLPAMATGAGIEKYLESRKEGTPIPKAAGAGITSGATEYLTELTPIKILSKPGLSFLKRLSGGLIADVPGELVATITEMKAVDEGMLGKSYTPEQYTRALIDTAVTSGLVTLGATTAVQPFKGKPKAKGIDTGLDFSKAEKAIVGQTPQPPIKEDINALWEKATPVVEPILQPPISAEPTAIVPEPEIPIIRQPEKEEVPLPEEVKPDYTKYDREGYGSKEEFDRIINEIETSKALEPEAIKPKIQYPYTERELGLIKNAGNIAVAQLQKTESVENYNKFKEDVRTRTEDRVRQEIDQRYKMQHLPKEKIINRGEKIGDIAYVKYVNDVSSAILGIVKDKLNVETGMNDIVDALRRKNVHVDQIKRIMVEAYDRIKPKLGEVRKREAVTPAIIPPQGFTPIEGKPVGKPTEEAIKPIEQTAEEIQIKEPWQMTGEERANQVMKSYNEQLAPNVFGDTRPKIRKGDTSWNRIIDEHKSIIKEALDEGKPVPSEVLKDYPEFQAGVPGVQTVMGLPEKASPATHVMPTGEVMSGTKHGEIMKQAIPEKPAIEGKIQPEIKSLEGIKEGGKSVIPIANITSSKFEPTEPLLPKMQIRLDNAKQELKQIIKNKDMVIEYEMSRGYSRADAEQIYKNSLRTLASQILSATTPGGWSNFLKERPPAEFIDEIIKREGGSINDTATEGKIQPEVKLTKKELIERMNQGTNTESKQLARQNIGLLTEDEYVKYTKHAAYASKKAWQKHNLILREEYKNYKKTQGVTAEVKQLTKKDAYSIQKIEWANNLIQKTVPDELKRESQARRKTLGQAFETLRLHANKLGIEVPKLSTFYNPKQYADIATELALKAKQFGGKAQGVTAEIKPSEVKETIKDFEKILKNKEWIGTTQITKDGISFNGIRYGSQFGDISRGGTWYEIPAFEGAKSSYEAGKWYSRETSFGIGGKEKFETNILLKNPYLFDWTGMGEGFAPLRLANKVLGVEQTKKLSKGIKGINAEKSFAKIENATAKELSQRGYDGVIFYDRATNKEDVFHPKQAFVFIPEKIGEVKPTEVKESPIDLKDTTGGIGDAKTEFYNRIEKLLRNKEADISIPAKWLNQYAKEILGISTLPTGKDAVWHKINSTVGNKAGYDLLSGMTSEQVENLRKQGKYTGWQIKEVTLESLGLQSVYEKLASFVNIGKIKDGYNYVVEMANKIYTGGSFKTFVHDMKLALGNLWQHYKGMIPKVWRGINSKTQARVKQVLAYEVGEGKTLTAEQLEKIGMSKADINAYKKHKGQYEKFRPLSELQNPFVRRFIEFWSPLSTLPDSLKYNIERYKSFGDVARIEKLVGNVIEKTRGYSDETNKMLFKFLDGDLKLEGLPQEVRRYAVTLQGMNRRIGQMLVKRGLITQKAWEAHKDEYIRYVYLKYTLGEEDIPTTGGKIDKAALKGRIDPIIKSRIAGKEYVDKNIYEGLLKVAENLGIKHDRLLKAGRGILGYATKEQIMTPFGFTEAGGKIVTQFATELSVLAHEIGHQLDYKYDLWDRIVTNAEGIGKRGVITKTASTEKRGTIQEELRALADLKWEGIEVSAYHKKYVRKQVEKMAHMLEAYIHAPERFEEVAPTVYKEFDLFVNSIPELQGLSELKQGLSLKELQQTAYQVVSASGKKYTTDNLTLKEAQAKQAEIQKKVDKYRKAIGLIEDVSIAEPASISIALQNVAAYDKLSKIADNPDWVWQPSVVKIEGVKWGIGALKTEVEKQGLLVAKSPDSVEIRERFDMLNKAYEQAQEESGNEPEDFLQLPTSASYGKLSGMFVRKPIYRDLVPILSGFQNKNVVAKTMNAIIKLEAKGMGLFKIAKTALNIPAYARNIVSNIIQLNFSGIPLYDVPGYAIKGLNSIIAKDANYTKAFRDGLFKTNFTESEMKDLYETFKKMEGKTWFDIVEFATKLGKYYGKIDDVFKMAKYIEQIENGVSHNEAIVEAQKWGMDYSTAHPSVKYLRRHVMPFASYSYKVTELMAEAMVKRPWVVAKYFAIPALMTAWARESLDLSDDDWEKLKRMLPLFIKKSNTMTVLPYKSETGDLNWIDLEYFFPGQMWLALYRDIKNKDYWEVSRDVGITNPFADVYAMMQSARGKGIPKDPYTGKDIYNELDWPSEKALKTAEWVYNKWAPQMLTRIGTAGKIAGIGKEDKYGRIGTAGRAAGSLFGVNIISPTKKQVVIEKRAREKELTSSLYRKLSDTKDETKREQVKERYRNALQEIYK